MSTHATLALVTTLALAGPALAAAPAGTGHLAAFKSSVQPLRVRTAALKNDATAFQIGAQAHKLVGLGLSAGVAKVTREGEVSYSLLFTPRALVGFGAGMSLTADLTSWKDGATPIPMGEVRGVIGGAWALGGGASLGKRGMTASLHVGAGGIVGAEARANLKIPLWRSRTSPAALLRRIDAHLAKADALSAAGEGAAVERHLAEAQVLRDKLEQRLTRIERTQPGE